MIFKKMSQDTVPSLSQYFGATGNKEDQIDFSQDLIEAKSQISTHSNVEDNKKSNKIEPEVCRIFSETPSQSKDPTEAFFDLIGSSNHITHNKVISDLGLPSTEETYSSSRLVVGNETDRRRDAWIPSENTRQCLIAAATASPGTYFPQRETLTMPGVLLEEELEDAVGQAVSMCLGEAEAAQRRVLSANDVTQDERGLRELVQAGAYRAAINLTSRLLTIYGQGRGRAGQPSKHSPHSLQLWFTRIALLVKTKAFNIASAEAEPFGNVDKPDMYFQFYPEMYGGRLGSMASFSFRLLLAELPMHCGKAKESITRLFKVLATVRQIISNLKRGHCEDGNPMELTDSDKRDSLRLWNGREVRVMHSIINSSLAVKEYELAMDLLGQLCERDGAPRPALLSALGRLHLQMGNIPGAEVCFKEAAEIKGGHKGVRELVDKGLLSIAQSAFDEAYLCFQEASVLEPSNVMILNNMGVCLLYGGHLKEAIQALETAIASNPVHALNESLLLNLCTLYDMESSKGRMKKFALLRQISRYQADAPTMILEKLYG
ncbi:trafficking protein particle complex subunit 12 [Diorhabda sublineata]|uniref:trafficking protein particle complex subunit 12 n=1 Tax=Diorhabda sublineata TaxID=1163346 RepID=UPI0024E078CF|nr:trafficking protein particle complex subunit 12 [Diorhabda sublineata]